jgi:hypothetical protein
MGGCNAMGWAPATAGARCEFPTSHAPHRRRGTHRPSRAARRSCGSLSRRRCPPSRAAHPMAGPVRTASNATAPSICYRNSRAFSTCQQRGQHLAQVLQELLHSRVRLLPRTPATCESPHSCSCPGSSAASWVAEHLGTTSGRVGASGTLARSAALERPMQWPHLPRHGERAVHIKEGDDALCTPIAVRDAITGGHGFECGAQAG